MWYLYLPLIPIMGILYRFHGGMEPKMPWKTAEILIAMVCVIPLLFISELLVIATVGVFLLVALIKASGHGQWMTLNFNTSNLKAIEPERLGFIVKLFFGADPRTQVKKFTNKKYIRKKVEEYGETKLYLRCLFGLFISGASVVLPVSIALAAFSFYIPALTLFLIAGFGKALGYALGWKFYPEGKGKGINEEFDEATEYGEIIAGLTAGLAVYVTICLTFL
tara:strand:- start:177 stop:842 length:666 start_codon:yes stop_codon:yes gene_type:complete